MEKSILDSRLIYNKETGHFFWINGKRESKKAGGYDKEGYWMIKLEGKYWFAHRLAWLWVYGELPNGIIDHINKIKDDNRIENLRICNTRQNRYNSKLNKNNTSGYRGVHWAKLAKKWKVAVHTKEKYILVGYFKELKDAVKAYNDFISKDEELKNYLTRD